jgi:hypothetical protein
MSWRTASVVEESEFPPQDFQQWQKPPNQPWLRVGSDGRLMASRDQGATSEPWTQGWRIPLANSVFATSWGAMAGGPGGFYRAGSPGAWTELKLWREEETGAADFLHAYWMGRYYGFVTGDL